MRRPFVSLLVMLVLLVGADYLVKDYVSGRIESELDRSFGTSKRPEVAIEAFPFLLAAFSGRVDGLEVTARDITVDRITFSEVRLTLDEVTFSTGDIMSGSARRVVASSGEGTATLTGTALTRIVGRESPDLEVAVQGNTVSVSTPQAPAPASAEVELRDNTLIVVPEGLEAIAIPLPDITTGLTYEEVAVRNSAVVLSFKLERPRLDLDHRQV